MSGIDIEKSLVKSCLEWDLTISIDYVLPDGGIITYSFRRSPNEARYYDKTIGRRTKRVWTQTKVIVCYKTNIADDTLNFLDMHIPFTHFEKWCLLVNGEIKNIYALKYDGTADDEWEKEMNDVLLPKITRYYNRQKSD